MATTRKKRAKRNTTNLINFNIARGRDANAIANETQSLLTSPYLIRSLDYYTSLQLVTDYRRYHPDPFEPPRTISNNYGYRHVPRSITRRSTRKAWTKPYGNTTFPSHRLVYANPQRVILCIRRNRRRQVIHALGIAGSRVKKPTRNINSSISCRS